MADEKKNTGNYNTGHRNTGHRNTGYYNTGNYNTGYYNTGDYNTGYYNTGHRNTGDYNTGHRNTGHYNIGSYNTGDYNTGYYNTGDYNTGYFCTRTPAPVFFDQPCSLTWDQAREAIPYVELPVGCEWVGAEKMTDSEKKEFPQHTTTGGFLRVLHKSIQTAFPVAWAKLNVATKKKFLALPNFDAEKFFACTGVDVRLDGDLFPQAKAVTPVSEIKTEVVWKEVTIDGKRYQLWPIDEK